MVTALFSESWTDEIESSNAAPISGDEVLSGHHSTGMHHPDFTTTMTTTMRANNHTVHAIKTRQIRPISQYEQPQPFIKSRPHGKRLRQSDRARRPREARRARLPGPQAIRNQQPQSHRNAVMVRWAPAGIHSNLRYKGSGAGFRPPLFEQAELLLRATLFDVV